VDIKNLPTLGLWLGSMPVIIASFISSMVAPYAINRGAAASRAWCWRFRARRF
jgi:hypothetical protein